MSSFAVMVMLELPMRFEVITLVLFMEATSELSEE